VVDGMQCARSVGAVGGSVGGSGDGYIGLSLWLMNNSVILCKLISLKFYNCVCIYIHTHNYKI
jgi:hypothetical protein